MRYRDGAGWREVGCGREQYLLLKTPLKKWLLSRDLNEAREGTEWRNGGRMFQEEQKAHVKVLRKKELGAIQGRVRRHCGWRGEGGEAGQEHWGHVVEPSHQSRESGSSSSMLWECAGELWAARCGLLHEKQGDQLRNDHNCWEEQ